MKKLAIITTHPIQYNAPWFRQLAENGKVKVKVFYTWSQVKNKQKFDPGFGRNIVWDIPLLDGYDYTFVNNTSKSPGSKAFKGIQNPTLISEVEEWRPDSVLVIGWNFKSHLKLMRYFHNKIPVLFRGDSHFLNRKTSLTNLIRKLVLKWVFHKVDCALFVGENNKMYFKIAGLTGKQLWHVPHAVDNDHFRENYKSRDKGQELRQSLSIPSHSTVFLFAGKFKSIKNPLLMLKVAKEIKNKNIHFVFAGNGLLEDLLKKGKGETIHFLDFQNQKDMPGLYQLADVFVLPSKSETWGLSVNEAMAAGKPVLVSSMCGCATDLIKVGINGYIFESENKEDLMNKICLLLEQKERLKQMGENGIRIIEEFSFSRIATQIELLMAKLKEN